MPAVMRRPVETNHHHLYKNVAGLITASGVLLGEVAL